MAINFAVSIVLVVFMRTAFSLRLINRMRVLPGFVNTACRERTLRTPRKQSIHMSGKNEPHFHRESTTKYFEYERLEREIYSWWESSGYFKPSLEEDKKPFVIPMPPPNVTGYLHMGHAMFVALQDIMARFHRMRGKATLWLPGTDHAGIATQLLVERALTAEGLSRASIGRDAFLDRVWKWKEEKGGYITQQMRRLGASADWSRERFTLEPTMSSSVTEAFVRLHEKGLVYRGNYLVNWSPNLQTAVSDLEVEYSEEVGTLYFFKYMLSGSESGEFIPVATTRPETILGDSAVCVHPEDSRYQQFIGKMVKVPMQEREIPIIADEYVDREFGTGALKITPAHDPNDYELGIKHNLPLISIMNKDATINENGGSYEGLDRFECRKRIWEDMENLGLVIKAEDHTQRVPRSQRGGEVIEPMLSAQWFVRMEDMANKAVDAVRSREIQIIPDRFEKVWYNWLENCHDWCVSRQLWWGHRIPVYYVVGSEDYIVARSDEEAHRIAREKYGESVTIKQDEDVLDTWFSSGLWPFATVGWPADELNEETSRDLARFYPASVLETGYDILFFWVARMVMMGIEFTGKVPFHTIYMHGLVRDGQGRKMSKTTGNVIDPIETIDKYGCDALRFSLVTGSTPGQDVPLSMDKVEINRNFANKLWNVGKYIQNVVGSESDMAELAVVKPMDVSAMRTFSLAELYIVSRCHEVVLEVTDLLEGYQFGEAGRLIYEFLWDEFADWYIEASKTKINDPVHGENAKTVLVYVWDRALRLLHPYMPYLTETLWQLNPHVGPSIMIADWPITVGNHELYVDKNSIESFQAIQSLVRAVRNARAEYNVEPGKKIGLYIRASTELISILETERAVISLLGRVNNDLLTVSNLDSLPPNVQCINLVVKEGLEAYLPLSDLIDREKELSRLGKQLEKLTKDITGLEARLQSKGFVDKAPEAVISEVRATLSDKKAQVSSIERNILELK